MFSLAALSFKTKLYFDKSKLYFDKTKLCINSSNRFKLKSTQYISIPTRISSGKCEMKVRFTHNKTISLKAYLQISSQRNSTAKFIDNCIWYNFFLNYYYYKAILKKRWQLIQSGTNRNQLKIRNCKLFKDNVEVDIESDWLAKPILHNNKSFDKHLMESLALSKKTFMFKILLCNCRSLLPKLDELNVFNNINICSAMFLTETWLNVEIENKIVNITNYRLCLLYTSPSPRD